MVEKFLTANSDDWFRLSSENYILWTNQDLVVLSRGISQLPNLNHFTAFASEFHAASHGFGGIMPQEFWTWLYQWRPIV
jgi:hypothetical protein